MPAIPKAAAEQRWVVNVEYLRVEKPGETPVRYEQGDEFPNPTNQMIGDGWVKPADDKGGV